ncbi:Maintenance of ploidy protein-like protein [Emericellopsis cladophorae]|uniref:Maintenance of ploidy protein-like protein n=1 Tax=Emericellopsis cladophorae TaxID=2686198 RepID=A0A9P9Y015_9HYPO|nr:Maintenance of ploidy protein-like protein [Emericellopsis cladophorae]KAI6780633.1 Maintenance of ploidy protein-like protein [Emericellopsis cladophorae]
MSNFISGINARFRGSSGRTERSPGPAEGPLQPPPGSSSPAATPTPAGAVASGPLPFDGPVSSWPRPLPAWLSRPCAKHIVKGNFMTLSARPKTVDQGEWIAHQVVEHYRVLWNFVRVVVEKDEDGTSICNRQSCPKMSAGSSTSYTWLNSRHEPVELPAYEYMTLMQRWISGKIDDTNLFPSDPAGVSSAPYADAANPDANGADDYIGRRSGFPKEFPGICRTIFLQMFRVYAHLYWDHFLDPFYQLNLEKQLNSCFSHFVLTATTLDLLRPEDLEPMKPLVDMWAADGTLPPDSKAYGFADLKQGKELVDLSAAAA